MLTLLDVYNSLLDDHGPQYWWPGDSRFEIMVGAVLTQNTAWPNVEKAIGNLKHAQVLSPQAIVSSDSEQLAALLRPSGYFNIKARRLLAMCTWLQEQGGETALAKRETPVLREQLLTVHGIGPETADDILLYAFDRPVFVVDTYTRRLFGRLGLVDANAPYETIRTQFESTLAPEPAFFNEYHALIVNHGKHICRPQARCDQCCLKQQCVTAA